MQNYAPGSPAAVTFNLATEGGAVVIPTALRWRVLDEAETVLQDWQVKAIPEPMEDQLTLSIIGALNILTPPAIRGIRTVELEVTTDIGSFMLSESVLLQGISALSVGANSFLTYAQALLEAQNYAEANVSGWARTSARDERERALIQAHASILQLPLRLRNSSLDPQSFLTDSFSMPSQVWLRDIGAERYATWVGESMKAALRQAQLLEAAEVLNGDPIAMARRNGMMSMTVGESSQFFGQAKALDIPLLSRPAYDLLKRWMDYRVILGRGS